MSIQHQCQMSIPGLDPAKLLCWGPGRLLSSSLLFCPLCVLWPLSFRVTSVCCFQPPRVGVWKFFPPTPANLLSSHPHPLFDTVWLPVYCNSCWHRWASANRNLYHVFPYAEDSKDISPSSPAVSWGSAAAGAHALPRAVPLSSAFCLHQHCLACLVAICEGCFFFCFVFFWWMIN